MNKRRRSKKNKDFTSKRKTFGGTVETNRATQIPPKVQFQRSLF